MYVESGKMRLYLTNESMASEASKTGYMNSAYAKAMKHMCVCVSVCAVCTFEVLFVYA